MATKNKTNETAIDVRDFINSHVDNELRKAESFQLIELMTKWSGFEPKMWGPSIIGFGSYHYKYASGHEGDSMFIGFSPRKAEFSLYESASGLDNRKLLDELGKYRMGKACIYAKKLSDINIDILEKICQATIKHIHENHSFA